MSDESNETMKMPVAQDVAASPGASESRGSRPEIAPGTAGPRASLIDLDWVGVDEDTAVTRTTQTGMTSPFSAQVRNKVTLTLLTGLHAGQVFPIEADETTMGRGRDATVRIEDVGMSRVHSRILRSPDGRYFLQDMNSTNGTFLGGHRIENAVLNSGDHIQLGPNVALKFAMVDESEDALARQLYESSTRDPLTRAFNRKYFAERLQSEVAYANRHKTKLGVILFDLDYFKRVNDTYGHLAGDEVLRTVSAAVSRLIRSEDVFARYGGEEFVILVRGIDPRNVALFAERIRRATEKLQIVWEGQAIAPTISAGVAALADCAPVGQGTGDAMLILADERLYRAKAEGRNRVCSA